MIDGHDCYLIITKQASKNFAVLVFLALNLISSSYYLYICFISNFSPLKRIVIGLKYLVGKMSVSEQNERSKYNSRSDGRPRNNVRYETQNKTWGTAAPKISESADVPVLFWMTVDADDPGGNDFEVSMNHMKMRRSPKGFATKLSFVRNIVDHHSRKDGWYVWNNVNVMRTPVRVLF